MNEYDALEEVRWQLEVALREIDGGGGGEPQRRSSTSAIPPAARGRAPEAQNRRLSERRLLTLVVGMPTAIDGHSCQPQHPFGSAGSLLNCAAERAAGGQA
jgi:hypothetical protein